MLSGLQGYKVGLPFTRKRPRIVIAGMEYQNSK